MTEVTAIRSFEHYGSRKKGDVFDVSPQVAEQLMKRLLVTTGDTPVAEQIEGSKPRQRRRRD
jgi:hypothetical protein